MSNLEDLSISEIKALLNSGSGGKRLLEEAAVDRRKGVRALAASHKRKALKERGEFDRLKRMIAIEKDLIGQGYLLIAGVDEVGRGCLAGPLVAAAVILPAGLRLNGVRDSKELDAAERQRLSEEIKEASVDWAVVEMESESIDRYGVHRANIMALTEVPNRLTPPPDYILADGFSLPGSLIPHRKIVKGDSLSQSIAAASIIAKVHRDRLMDDLSLRYPGYGFDRNKGYGTDDHLSALRSLGPCPIHRRSFAPVQSWNELQLSLDIQPKNGPVGPE